VSQSGSQSSLISRLNIKEPDKFDVYMLNDDFTTMDFVVEVLRTVFYRNAADAEQIMLEIHNNGKALVGTYSYDIARSKVNMAEQMARAEGFPLRLHIERKG
jgi:ATP-dependent Clp protease adaptor protein ClpS